MSVPIWVIISLIVVAALGAWVKLSGSMSLYQKKTKK